MIRNRKALGLALVSALAIFALAANASATNPQFHGEEAHTTFAGWQEGRNTFNVDAGTVHCNTASFHGTRTQSTSAELTVTPTYEECTFTFVTPESGPATVHMNGCHYLLTAGGTVHLNCPSGPIRITAPLCTITVHPQTINRVDYTNFGSGAERGVTVTSTATNIAYTQSTFCPGGGGPRNNGTYSGAVLATCTDTEENSVGCWWSTE
jgi:hypothetical protein